VARALVAKELARTVYYVLHRQEDYNGTFKGHTLSRTKQPKWPPLTNPVVQLEPLAEDPERAAPL
jgi:hypothetical protein